MTVTRPSPGKLDAVRSAQRSARCRAIAASTANTPAPTIPAGTRPSVRRPRSAWLAWLESTDPLLWWDRAEPALWCESREAADIADPIDPAEANEPTLANDAKEAALPIERTESWEQIERIEFSDQRDHTRRIVVRDQARSHASGQVAIPHLPFSSSSRITWRTALIRARWVNA